jgi:hypothetical protein
MASSGKKKTTMAKMAREHRMRERRLDKQARKTARKAGLLEHAEQPEDARVRGEAEPPAEDGPAPAPAPEAAADDTPQPSPDAPPPSP